MQKIVTMIGDLTLTAYYEQGFTLAISSTPVPAQFTLNGQTLQTPFNQALSAGNYNINMPATIGDYRFKQWNDGDTNPNKSISLTADTQLTATYEYVAPPPPPPEKGRLEVHAFQNTTEIVVQVEVVGVGTFNTPFSQDVDPGTYVLNMTYQDKTQTKTVTVASTQTFRVDFQISPPPLTAGLTIPAIIAVIVIGGASLYFATKKK